MAAEGRTEPMKSRLVQRREAEEIAAIEGAMAANPDGMRIMAIVDSVEPMGLSKRTVLRRLAQCIQAGRIRREGRTRTVTYRLEPTDAG